MRFHVTNYITAQSFKPMEPTLAIRIFDPGYDPDHLHIEGNHKGKLLLESHWWVAELCYTFQDLDPTGYELEAPEVAKDLRNNKHCFNNIIARKMLFDFNNHYQNSAAVLIHCNAGLSRSPAAALALAHRFKLNPEWKGGRHKMMKEMEEELKTTGRAGNMWVYRLLMGTEIA